MEMGCDMIQYSKLQIGCILIVLYVAFIYFRERQAYGIKKKERMFELLIGTGIICIALDGTTAYTVNFLDTISPLINGILHACFLSSLDIMIFVIFMYILDITWGIPKNKKHRTLIKVPLIINVAIVILFTPQLEYRDGGFTNYSMGISAYTCYIMISIYMIGIVAVLLSSWKNIGHYKLITIGTCIATSIIVTIYQMFHPEALLTCLVPTIVIIGAYLNMENPALLKLKAYNHEMVMGFATLVENRDGSTGGHIKRTTTYVEMLAEELKNRGLYKEELTEDYIKNLIIAAPMHDVGKIAIPDSILQKPGKLTVEEFAIMKIHAEKGGQIIEETFGHLGDEEYEKMAYQVARYHHEKWNGKGYPEGLTGENIPLCARIMAVADVFDAVSANRCYRGAMPIDQCFGIIESGIGQDFDPVIAQVFLDIKDKVSPVVKTI